MAPLQIECYSALAEGFIQNTNENTQYISENEFDQILVHMHVNKTNFHTKGFVPGFHILIVMGSSCCSCLLTRLEQNNGFQTCVLSGVHIGCLELINSLLDCAHCGHDVNYFLRRRVVHVHTGRGQNWRDFQWHGPLAGAEKKEFPPSFFQKNYLVE